MGSWTGLIAFPRVSASRNYAAALNCSIGGAVNYSEQIPDHRCFGHSHHGPGCWPVPLSASPHCARLRQALVSSSPYSRFKPPPAIPSTCPTLIWLKLFVSEGSIFSGSAIVVSLLQVRSAQLLPGAWGCTSFSSLNLDATQSRRCLDGQDRLATRCVNPRYAGAMGLAVSCLEKAPGLVALATARFEKRRRAACYRTTGSGCLAWLGLSPTHRIDSERSRDAKDQR